MVVFGIKTPPQHGPWADFLDVWRAADDIELFESAWTMDHFYPLSPPLDGTHLESWAVLAAMAQATKRVRLASRLFGKVESDQRHPRRALCIDRTRSVGDLPLGAPDVA